MSTLEELESELADSRRQNQILQQRVQQLLREADHQRRENSDFERRLARVRSIVNRQTFTLTVVHVRFYNNNILKFVLIPVIFNLTIILFFVNTMKCRKNKCAKQS